MYKIEFITKHGDSFEIVESSFDLALAKVEKLTGKTGWIVNAAKKI